MSATPGRGSRFSVAAPRAAPDREADQSGGSLTNLDRLGERLQGAALHVPRGDLVGEELPPAAKQRQGQSRFTETRLAAEDQSMIRPGKRRAATSWILSPTAVLPDHSGSS